MNGEVLHAVVVNVDLLPMACGQNVVEGSDAKLFGDSSQCHGE